MTRRAPSFRGHRARRDVERDSAAIERECAYCVDSFEADPGERFCSGYCREHGDDIEESGDGLSGDGLFTAEEHARWDSNLALLVSRVDEPGFVVIGRDVDGDEAAFRSLGIDLASGAVRV